MPDEKRIPEAVAKARLGEILDKVAQEYVPRVIVDAEGVERAIVVNAARYRQMVAAAEEHEYLSQRPENVQLRSLLKESQAQRKVLVEELDAQMGRLATELCPRCRADLDRKYGPKTAQDANLWQKLRGTLTDAAEGTGGAVQAVDVAVVGAGE